MITFGNVRQTIKTIGGNTPDEASSDWAYSKAEYYPFGMKFMNVNSYRYGYQGEYAEDETGEDGIKANSFQLRLYNPRLGRWMSPDPYGQYHSPYLSMGNNPVSNIDPDGGTAIVPLWIVDPLGFFTKINDATYWENSKGVVSSTKHNEGDKEVDKIIGIDADNKLQSIAVDPMFMKSEKSHDQDPIRTNIQYLKTPEHPMHTYSSKTHEESQEIIEFMNDVTLVEFSYKWYKNEPIDNFFIGTIHEEGASRATYKKVLPPFKLQYSLHNHPPGSSEKPEPSGLGKQNGDIDRVVPRIPHQIYYGKSENDTGYLRYFLNGDYKLNVKRWNP